MTLEPSYILAGVVLGIGATLLMDIWNLFLRRAFGIPSLNYCMLGRWVRHIPEGTFRHQSIAAAEQKPFECPVGWATHYTIGVALAIVFAAFAGADWLARPSVLPAIVYGIATLVFPLFVLQPALGMGLASSKTRNPAQARLKSLATHTVFGLGLYVTAVGLSQLL